MDGALWAYALLALTTLPPLVPNSALIAAAGVLAASGRLSLPLVLLTVAGSALVGDAAVHWLGCRAGGRVRAWLSASPRRKAALDWTAARVWRHGVPFVFVVRFLPSGRLAGGLAAGTVGYPLRRFLVGAGLAELFWAAYSVGVGYWGGHVLAGTLTGTLVGVGASAVLAGSASAVHWGMRRGARAAVVVPRQGGTGPRLPHGEERGGRGPVIGDGRGVSGVEVSAASPVPGPAGDPVADGVGEPVGLARLH
ncbi:DedA family protein [Streptomyces iconiensis]|uniref:VTT domain-containing protein n=1 Tax=Streptomyces iconiensis TaxID=1384038 RepID=A0ABT6ZWZ3_9ACTN|nr:VTT domain-containing protein [Streptomyces iconiensis]MDJ1133362.1 VTT domain-containing protein [Streptomyces iconiensis]